MVDLLEILKFIGFQGYHLLTLRLRPLIFEKRIGSEILILQIST